VFALQEVGGVDALAALQGELGGTYPHLAISQAPDPRLIRVAFLSKHPLGQVEDMVDFPSGPALDIHELSPTGGSRPVTRMGRGGLRARGTARDFTTDPLTAHLKSKLVTFPRPGGSSFQPRDENERTQAAGVALMRRTRGGGDPRPASG
jgi:hypothetical protein